MRTPVALYVVALAVRLALIAGFPDPAYVDSAYYVEVARSLAAGRGFSVDFIWIFAEVGGRIPAVPTLPIPSNGHWMPLASLVQVPFILLLGPTALASAIPFALIGALAAPIAWLIARDAGMRPLVAVGAALLTSVPALSTVFMAQPDNFSLYQPIVAAALLLASRALRGDARAFVGAGLLAGLATLARNDGLLIVGVLGLVALWDRRHGRTVPVWASLGAALAFLVVIAPWWLRQLATFGTLSPSTASGRALFIRSIAEWDSITGTPTLGYLLGQGAGPFLASRIGGLVAGAWIFTLLIGAVVLVPGMVAGIRRMWRSNVFGPYLAYAAIFFAFSGIVSAVHVPGGTFLHSAVALAPHGYVLALEGILGIVGWIAARRRAWNEPQAGRVIGSGIVAIVAISGLAFADRVHADWTAALRAKEAVGDALVRAGASPSDRLMSTDPASYRYATGHPGVVAVTDPLEVNREVARAYGIRWLVLDGTDIVPAMAPVLRGSTRPEWIGPPIFVANLDGDPGPDLGVYPVCFATGDLRCTALGLLPDAGATP